MLNNGSCGIVRRYTCYIYSSYIADSGWDVCFAPLLGVVHSGLTDVLNVLFMYFAHRQTSNQCYATRTRTNCKLTSFAKNSCLLNNLRTSKQTPCFCSSIDCNIAHVTITAQCYQLRTPLFLGLKLILFPLNSLVRRCVRSYVDIFYSNFSQCDCLKEML